MNQVFMKGGEKNMNKQENDTLTIIEDLPVDEARQDEVKGGTRQVSGFVVTFDRPVDPIL
jgi:hypothetical protein